MLRVSFNSVQDALRSFVDSETAELKHTKKTQFYEFFNLYNSSRALAEKIKDRYVSYIESLDEIWKDAPNLKPIARAASVSVPATRC